MERPNEANSSRSKLSILARQILAAQEERTVKARHLADALRQSGSYRWVGLYDVGEGTVKVIAWSGPGAPAYPVFPVDKGLTGQAVLSRKTIIANNVQADPHYLTTFGSTQSEIIVPVINRRSGKVVGTVDVESEQRNAFSVKEQMALEQFARKIQSLWK